LGSKLFSGVVGLFGMATSAPGAPLPGRNLGLPEKHSLMGIYGPEAVLKAGEA